MKKIITLAALLGLAILSFTLIRPASVSSERPVVAITQIASHPALDEVRDGLISGLEKRGFKHGQEVTVIFRNAEGDPSLTVPIAEDFLKLRPSVIVPISTPSALGVVKAAKNTPVVFSGVTDPVATGLVDSLEAPNGNVTGVSDRWPFAAQFEAYFHFFPETRVIGMLYTRGDDVSMIGVREVMGLSNSLDFELELVPVSAAQDVYPAAVSLLRRVDAIYTGIDHLLLENMDGLVKASEEAGKPLFGGESGSVEKGAVLALSINMSRFGDLTADIVARVLKGEAPGAIPVAVVSDGDLLVNRKAAERFSLDPEALQARGVQFVDE